MLRRVLAMSCALLVTCVCSAPAQLSVGPVGYIDTREVNEAFWAESEAARQYNAAYERALADASRVQNELSALRAQRADARDRGDTRRVDAISDQIADLEIHLLDLQERWERDSDALWSQLAGDDFFMLLLEVIQYVAESRGFLSVRDVANDPSVLYHSHEVDLTAAVIEELNRRQR